MARQPSPQQFPALAWPATLLVALWAGGAPLLGQYPAAAPAGEQVVEVRVVGNRSMPEAKIFRYIRTKPGRPFDAEEIENDVRRLSRTGMFVSVKPYRRRVAQGLVVVFEVLERPILEEVKYVGNKKIKKRILEKEVELKVGDALDPYAIEDGRRKIEEYYHQKGFNKARVTILEGDEPEDRRVVYLIHEGLKQKVRWVNFVGNTIASDSRLRTQIKSKPPIFFLFKGEVDRKQIDEDVNRLTVYYRSLGFFRARVGRELNFSPGQQWLSLTFVIDEGPRYKVRNVSFVGNKKFSSEELASDIELPGGQYFNQSRMRADLQALQEKYGSVGYVFADIKADPRFLEEPGVLDLVYDITERDRYRVGRINVEIKGEYPHTQIATVLNRISLRPGDIVDIRELRDSERRLRASQLFEVSPQKGVVPKIVFSPPELEKVEEEIARKRKRPPSVRGQSPDGALGRGWGRAAPAELPPGDRSLDLTFHAEWADRPPQPPDSPPPPPARPQSDHQGGVTVHRGLSQSSRRVDVCAANSRFRRERGHGRGQVHFSDETFPGKCVLPPKNGPVSRPSAPLVVRGQYTTDFDRRQNQRPQPRQPAFSRWPDGGQLPPPGPVAAAPQESGELPGLFSPDSPYLTEPGDEEFTRPLPLRVPVWETQTGRFMFGVGVNSDAGLVGSIVIDERNFDWTRCPRSWDDIRNATAWRGAGQRFRLEAVPGTQVQRYMASFQEPYLLNSDVSLGLSGFYYDRLYRDWDEQRIGGRVSLGYHFTHRLSGSLAYRGEKVNIHNPVISTLPELNEVVGDSALHGFRAQLTHDTRDSSFLATEGHLAEVSFEQVIGTFKYPRGEVDLRQYFLLHERPDGSGRHVLSLNGRLGITGDDTPIYDHYFAGGFSTIRGFDFRGASPNKQGVFVGGHFMVLASAEYMFPITADDMLRAVVFCDTGTVEPSVDDWSDNYRIAPGFGLRIIIPAMGPAPIAFDFAFPVSTEPSDREEIFSFFLGILR